MIVFYDYMTWNAGIKTFRTTPVSEPGQSKRGNLRLCRRSTAHTTSHLMKAGPFYVDVGVGVGVSVGVGVWVSVLLGSGVLLGVGVWVGVLLGVSVLLGAGVCVEVGVRVGAGGGVWVGVWVGVGRTRRGRSHSARSPLGVPWA